MKYTKNSKTTVVPVDYIIYEQMLIFFVKIKYLTENDFYALVKKLITEFK